MEIVHISDTHGEHRKVEVPNGDILIHSGDFCAYGHHLAEVKEFDDWLGTLPHKHKIVIAGNHDHILQDWADAKDYITNATYLQDDYAVVEDLFIYGSPWTPQFGHWAFMLPRNELLLDFKWDDIPDCTDVLVTHGPPYGYRDKAVQDSEFGGRLGCELLRKRVERVRPLLHLFGHIHGGYGIHETDVTTFVNSAIMNEAYRPVNKPTVIKLRKNGPTDTGADNDCSYSLGDPVTESGE